MCGITGFINVTQSPEDKQNLLTAMMSSIAHRGPDAHGLWTDSTETVYLGHQRLSIQDLSNAGSQPMISGNDRYVIIFNGEIYNFHELIKDLKKSGYRFRGHSDTEALLAAIEIYGLESALQSCTGMFAFALWDKHQKTLYLVRDRVGEKPLYYGWNQDTFLFASELKAIVRYCGKAFLEIDENALVGYLRYGYIPSPYSIYREIYKLPPGGIFKLELAHKPLAHLEKKFPNLDNRIKPFWCLSDTAASGYSRKTHNPADLYNELEQRIRTSVQRQLISDVPVGTFLSGGIDSTLITAIAAQTSTQQINTYTVGFNEAQFDEAKFAASVARHIGTQHNELYLSSRDALDLVPKIPSIYDEPFANASQIPSYLISKFARGHVKVCLSGDGGDELFAGYNRYIMPLSLAKKTARIPTSLLKLAGIGVSAVPEYLVNAGYQFTRRFGKKINQQSNVDLKLAKLAQYLKNPDIDAYYTYLLSFCHTPEKLIHGRGNEKDFFHSIAPPAALQESFIARAQLRDQLTYLPDDNLAKMDRASMAVGLEVRAPLLSYDILELSWRFPIELKVHNGISKWPLREILYRHVPKKIMDRPKMGFTVPISQWLREDLKDWADTLLNQRKLHDSGLFDTHLIAKYWNDHLARRSNNANILWTILMYLSWENTYR